MNVLWSEIGMCWKIEMTDGFQIKKPIAKVLRLHIGDDEGQNPVKP